MKAEVTPAQIRATAIEALQGPGARRQALLQELEQVEVELRPLIQKAIAVEVPATQIRKLTGLSRVTISRWVKEA